MSIEQVLEIEKDFYWDDHFSNCFPSSARSFALKAHGGQMYGKDKPYVYHLDRVAEVLIEFGFSDLEYLCAAYLHDVVEDTEVPIDEIYRIFGATVGRLVEAVTEPKGLNRKARHAASHPKIKATPGATILKLADRIANIRESIKDSSSLMGMYRREYKDFREHLLDEKDQWTTQMWACLDGLMG